MFSGITHPISVKVYETSNTIYHLLFQYCFYCCSYENM